MLGRMLGSTYAEEDAYTPKFKLTRAGRARLAAHIRYHYAAKTEFENPRTMGNVELSHRVKNAEAAILYAWEEKDEYESTFLIVDRVEDMTITGSFFLQAYDTHSGQREAIHFAAYEFELAANPFTPKAA